MKKHFFLLGAGLKIDVMTNNAHHGHLQVSRTRFDRARLVNIAKRRSKPYWRLIRREYSANKPHRWDCTLGFNFSEDGDQLD